MMVEVSLLMEKALYGGLLAFLADNLAAHLIGGFKESMSFSLQTCRTCMITPDFMHQNRHFIESVFYEHLKNIMNSAPSLTDP